MEKHKHHFHNVLQVVKMVFMHSRFLVEKGFAIALIIFYGFLI